MPRLRLGMPAANWARAELERYYKLHPGTTRDAIGFGFVSPEKFARYAEPVKWEKVQDEALIRVIRETWNHALDADFSCFPSDENTICIMLSLY
jgi:hypothetical protein